MSELRWNPLLGEWVAAGASDRGDERAGCALCPADVPEGGFDVAVVEHPFAILRADPPPPTTEGTALHPVRPARGASEVVVYSTGRGLTLATAPVERVYGIARVWIDRFEALGSLDYVKYVDVAENLVEPGAPPGHAHGRIDAYPFVPPTVARELELARAHEDRTGRCLLCDVVADERGDGRRLVAENGSFVAFVPFSARWPSEVHICSRRHLQALTDLHDEEVRDLAALLKGVLSALDGLAGGPGSALLQMHQRPTDGHRYDFYHFHVELQPARSSALGPCSGRLVNEALPEVAAAELRRHVALVDGHGEARRDG